MHRHSQICLDIAISKKEAEDLHGAIKYLNQSIKLNKKNAQLIITTHDTTLLDNEIFRRDQIYICSKDKERSSKLNSYIDYDLREESDFERAYLNGRVGGLPFVDESILDS